jgi:uncharacterized GH25 family protein
MPRAILLAFLIGPSLWCHDFWIEPSSFRPAAGGPLLLRFRVGQSFKGDPVPRLGALLVRFSLWGPEGERTVPGDEGTDPAGFLRAGQAGPNWVCYFSRASTVELEGAKFETYLQEEGLDAIAQLRARRGETARSATDHFVRCAKCFLTVGRPPASHAYAHAFGLPLELMLEADPGTSGPLPVRLLYAGKPVRGALVTAFRKDAPDQKLRVRTDTRGRALLPLDGSGMWLVKSTHMEPDGDGAWQSYWASLTFQKD